MNSPIKKTLSAIAVGGLLAGSAFAGPGDAYGAGFTGRVVGDTKPVSIALFKGSGLANAKNCPMIKEDARWIPTGNPKNPAVTKVVVGYKHEGCTATAEQKLACKGSNESCAAMLKGN